MNLQLLSTIMSRDVIIDDSYIEIEIEIVNNPKYSSCWLGKMPDRLKIGEAVYWLGLIYSLCIVFER